MSQQCAEFPWYSFGLGCYSIESHTMIGSTQLAAVGSKNSGDLKVPRFTRLVLHRARAGWSGAAAVAAAASATVRRPATGTRLTTVTAWAFVCSAVPSSKVAGGGIR